MRSPRSLGVTLLSLVAASFARAQETPPPPTLEDLQRRIEALEAEKREADALEEEPRGLESWLRHLRMSGSASTGYFDGGEDGLFDEAAFEIWDSRLFLEASLGEDVSIGESRVVRDMRFLFEWSIVRLGSFSNGNEVGELYVEFAGVADSDWLNLRVGRFQLPLGESYLRYSEGERDEPFITHSSGGPWYWDDGLRLHGSTEDDRYGYVASLTAGESSFSADSDSDKQVTLKLFAEPLDWLHVSATGARSGEIGKSGSSDLGSIWVGETAAMGIGAFTDVPTFQDGVEVPDGPMEIEDSHLVGADVVIRHANAARLWLAAGAYDIDAEGSSDADRTLQYWTAELILGGELVSSSIEPLYFGFRADGLRTDDDDEGYLLDLRFSSRFGFNMTSLENYSIVTGYRLNEHVTIKAQYTFSDVDITSGAAGAIRGGTDDMDYFAIVVAASF